MLISLIVKNGENFKEIEEPSLTALVDLDWNDAIFLKKCSTVNIKIIVFYLPTSTVFLIIICLSSS